MLGGNPNFARLLASCLELGVDEQKELEMVLQGASEPLEHSYVDPSMDSSLLVRSGSEFTHLPFVQLGTVVPWQFPYSELEAPFLIGTHEFLSEAERWVATYSAVPPAYVTLIPVDVMHDIVHRIPQVRGHMHRSVMRRLSRFYWTSLATSGSPASRVAAALVSRLALEDQDYGKERTINILQKDLVRLTTLSRSAVAIGLRELKKQSAISFGTDESTRFAGEVIVPDVDNLKDQAFECVHEIVESLLPQDSAHGDGRGPGLQDSSPWGSIPRL